MLNFRRKQQLKILKEASTEPLSKRCELRMSEGGDQNRFYFSTGAMKTHFRVWVAFELPVRHFSTVVGKPDRNPLQ